MLVHELYDFVQAARLFGKAPPKFHTLEFGAQSLEEPQMEVPKELQDGPAVMPHSNSPHTQQWPESESQPDIQEGLQVGLQLLCRAYHVSTAFVNQLRLQGKKRIMYLHVFCCIVGAVRGR